MSLVLVEEVEGRSDGWTSSNLEVLFFTRRGGGPSRRRSPSYKRGGYRRRGRGQSPHTLCALAAYGQDLTLVPVFGRGRAPCLTLPVRCTAGAWAGLLAFSIYGRRSYSKDDIRDSRSRSRLPTNWLLVLFRFVHFIHLPRVTCFMVSHWARSPYSSSFPSELYSRPRDA